jgi:hypothetical protein
MQPEEVGVTGDDLKQTPWVFVTLAAVAASLTVVFLGMRAVMEIGGACAEGGPFVPRRPCPKGVPALMVGGIWAGMIFAGLYIWRSVRAGAVSFAGFLWPALFISLGWNFLEFGLNPPGNGGLEWGWLVPAVVFFLMGGLPLVVVLPRFLGRLRGDAPSPSATAGRFGLGSVRAAVSAASVFRRAAGTKEGDLVTQLERLDALHRSGALDDQQYEAAKRAVLQQERPG